MHVYFCYGNTDAGACQNYISTQGRDIRGIQTLMLLTRLRVGPEFPTVRASTLRPSKTKGTNAI